MKDTRQFHSGNEPSGRRVLLLSSERRLLERRRKEGTISPQDLKRLEEHERSEAQKGPTEEMTEGDVGVVKKAAGPAAIAMYQMGLSSENITEEELSEMKMEVMIDDLKDMKGNLKPLSPLPIEETTNPNQFAGLMCTPQVHEKLQAIGVSTPLPIQHVAIPSIMSGRSVIVQSPTGSGKTLAYLMPLFARFEEGSKPRRGLIVAPTRELALQILSECVRYRGAGFGMMIVGGTERFEDQLDKMMKTTCPIVICTPDRYQSILATIRDKDQLQQLLGNLEVMVLDEVDKLLNPLNKHAPLKKVKMRKAHPMPTSLMMQRILQHHNRRSLPLQIVSCSATISRSLRQELARFDESLGMKVLDIVRLSRDDFMTEEELVQQNKLLKKLDTGGQFEAGAIIPPTIKHLYLSIRREEEKYRTLQNLLTAYCPTTPAILFLPNGLSVNEIIDKMHYSGIERAISIHRALGFDEYDAKNATGEPTVSEDIHNELVQRRENLRNSLAEQDNPPLIIMSESNARGLDFYFDVVFLWELPREVASYVHMAGRTGRLGRKGKVVTLVVKDLKKRVGLFESHLGVKFKYLADPDTLAPDDDEEDVRVEEEVDEEDEEDDEDYDDDYEQPPTRRS
ncbi:hypothetical protein GUITHDRAFT_117980 [Guillardia theta CCMP2712]|uniref:ATP-dependent RNA helicase n=2 Tax=Guillardia theta TaxID=55529 RepID=L1IIC7_GUITC|nr:hypothetical protein GUITHDRAFT_117980 [Guillardia theta CCMP2712]EKX35832.1 hypothetical protein GUITHDRAFT_117980 [Guillardia theta CCMP2712]|eukprot:XP_005822812.1 hypothetical protein GUITHDRAFT_117980 [Guillardia theta CCMP2712]